MMLLDHKRVTVNWPGGSGGNDNRDTFTMYTTEYPCFIFYEPREMPGYDGDGRGVRVFLENKNTSGNENKTFEQNIFLRMFDTSYDPFNNEVDAPDELVSTSNVVYAYKSGLRVRGYAEDDDGSATDYLHIIRLPKEFGY